jgi:DNA-binding response OmpR family regulator/nitrogen-specific signal transduction histidine kinase
VNLTPTILIVDDEPGMLQLLEAILLDQGYNLAFAENGADAIAQAKALTPDLILLDVMMPQMNGFEVCQHLRADSMLAEVPIIIITANDDPDSRLQGLRAGADDFLIKPVERLELRARVQTVTRLNRYRRLLGERMKFAWVVEQADEGYLNLNDKGEILYANHAARLYLNLPPDEGAPVAGAFLELARQYYRTEPEEAWANWPNLSAPESQSLHYLVRPETPSAKAFWLKVDVLDMRAADQVWLVRLRDVSAEVASQRGIEQFHRVIIHKLRTPLVGIIGGLELLTQHAAGLSGAEVAKFANISLQGAQRLRGEIEDVLQYLNAPAMAKLGEGFALDQLPGVVAAIAASLQLERVSVSGEASVSGARAVLSRQAVESILWEILENSRKFHPGHAPTVEITLARAGEAASVRIGDNGATLSPEQLARVWSPYYQGEKFFTGEMAGMGLGLPGVASLVWEVGGRCRIYNQPAGPGVVIELTLPIAPKH